MEPRKLLRYQSTWDVAEVMNYLVGALSGNGPAIAFGNVSSKSVPENVAVLLATSGSTGHAKDVALPACSLIESARITNNYLGAKPGDRWSLLVSLQHAAGVNVLVRSLELGTIPITDLNINVDFTAIVVTQLYRALNGDQALLNHLKSAKAVLIGGSAIPEDLLRKGSVAGINLVTTYGMTETSGGCVYNGTPLPGVEIRIGKTVEIKSPTLAINYLGNEALWNEKIKDGYFITDDLGQIENGKLIITGRIDDVIISGGKNISLSEIEKSLAESFPKIESVAFALPDPEWGASLNLAIVGDFDESDIHQALQSKYGVKAKRVLKINEFPKSALGKIDRGALASMVSK